MQQKIEPLVTMLNESFSDEYHYVFGEKIIRKELDKLNIKLPNELKRMYIEEGNGIYFNTSFMTLPEKFNILPINNIVT